MPTTPISDSLERYHAATNHPTLVHLPDRRMLAMDGLGEPISQAYLDALDTLHATWDHLRAAVHRDLRVDAHHGPVETAWWTHPEPPAEEIPEKFADRRTWHWQLMTEIPLQATDTQIDAALRAVHELRLPGADLVRFILMPGGRAAQILHVGPPSTEPVSLRRLYEAVGNAGVRVLGHIHEVLLSDPRTAPRDRLRLILRLPIEPVETPGRKIDEIELRELIEHALPGPPDI